MKVTVNYEPPRELDPNASLEPFIDGLKGRDDSVYFYEPGVGELRITGARRGKFKVECDVFGANRIFYAFEAKRNRDGLNRIVKSFSAGTLAEDEGIRPTRSNWPMSIVMWLVHIVIGFGLVVVGVTLLLDESKTKLLGGLLLAMGCFLTLNIRKPEWGEYIAPRLLALELFERIQREYPHLSMVLQTRDKSVDLNLDIPEQPGLSFKINANLQNGDELHLSTRDLWRSWFPVTNPDVMQGFGKWLRGLLDGRCYLVESMRNGKVIATQLSCGEPVARGFMYSLSTWNPFSRHPVTTRIIRNEDALPRTDRAH